MSGATRAGAPRRRDARHTRAVILATAIETLAIPGSTVAMHEIARRAGLGQATLYRHFRDRYGLAAAVIREQLDRLRRLAAANAGRPEAFSSVLDAVLRCQISMRPLVALVRRGDPRARERYLRQLVGVLAEPLRRAQRVGVVRADRAPEDLVLVFAMVEGVLDATLDATSDPQAAHAAAVRCIDLVLDGLLGSGTG